MIPKLLVCRLGTGRTCKLLQRGSPAFSADVSVLVSRTVRACPLSIELCTVVRGPVTTWQEGD